MKNEIRLGTMIDDSAKRGWKKWQGELENLRKVEIYLSSSLNRFKRSTL